jgi:broad specificity phosphatase PhoE
MISAVSYALCESLASFLIPSVRLEPVIFELERVQEDMLVISHASVIRCLVGYFMTYPILSVEPS